MNIIQLWDDGSEPPATLPDARVIRFPVTEDVRGASCTERVKLAAGDPDMVYFDCDARPLKGFAEFVDGLEPGTPFFSFRHGTPCEGIFIVNGATWFFDRLLDTKRKRNMPDSWRWLRKALKREKVGRIPDELFAHDFHTLSKENVDHGSKGKATKAASTEGTGEGLINDVGR